MTIWFKLVVIYPNPYTIPPSIANTNNVNASQTYVITSDLNAVPLCHFKFSLKNNEHNLLLCSWDAWKQTCNFMYIMILNDTSRKNGLNDENGNPEH